MRHVDLLRNLAESVTARNTRIHKEPRMLKTDGLSPKAILACLFPLASTLIYSLISWAFTGSFDTAEVRTAVTGAATSLLALAGAYIGDPGPMRLEPVDPSDAHLSSEAASGIARTNI